MVTSFLCCKDSIIQNTLFLFDYPEDMYGTQNEHDDHHRIRRRKLFGRDHENISQVRNLTMGEVGNSAFTVFPRRTRIYVIRF